ncbi:P2Y purinoceptor 12-like [Brachyhypopomus gauderio]|uniref:P2Y purinoceptor 12-like n=1 Tax=Brachyhypopomus gauderio TaxID=698409 RepID=UPI0040412DC7
MEVTSVVSAMQAHFANQSVGNCSRDSVLKTTVFPVLYSLLFVVGVPVNGLAAWVFLNVPSRSHFIIYLKNIVIADVIMTLTFPFKILSDSNVASVGVRVFVCRVSSVLFYLTMYVSILFFGLISVDRCRKTLWPFVGTSQKRLARRKILSGAIWAFLLALALPNMILSSRPPGSAHFDCSGLKTKLGLRWHEGVNYVCQVIFWSNLAVVVVCYTLITRELYSSYVRTRARTGTAQELSDRGGAPLRRRAKRRVRANVFLVLAVFFTCFVPFHFVRVPYTMSQTKTRLFGCDHRLLIFRMKESTLWLSSLNALLDPLIYFFLCKSFRDSLLDVLRLSPERCRLPLDSTDTTTGGNSPGHNSAL